jgi:peroxiredoxin Q/BCP
MDSSQLISHFRNKELAMLNVGEKAPDFSLPSHTGDKVSLKDFKGMTLVLYFFPKADTPG